MKFSQLTLFFLFYALPFNGSQASQQDKFEDKIFDSRLKTVQLYKSGWNLSYPIINSGSNDKLELHFDLLDDQPETYYYSFIHCDKNWRESGIFPGDYLDGFPEDQIEDYRPSFNTKINYYHYKLEFPNERINLRLSGNYIIKVYLQGEPEKPVLTKRFMITEDIAVIRPDVHRPQLTEYYNTGQQVDFTVSYSRLTVNDPYRDISAFILQNGKWFDAKSDLRPDFVGSNEVRYNSLSTKNIFQGGNEYRYFDLKSIRYQSEYIRKIDFINSSYHAYLLPSENREFKPYFFWQDFNGKYYVAVQEGRNMDTEADYIYVYFTVPSTYEVRGGKFYISGALSNWTFNNENMMTYDPAKAQYQGTMLLKQGWYNYEYIFLKDPSPSFEPSVLEGNHYETENDYLILIYYKNPRDRYDRLVGTKLTSSTNRLNN